MRPLRVRIVPVAILVSTLLVLYMLLAPSTTSKSVPQVRPVGKNFNYASKAIDDKPYDDLVKWLLKSGARFDAVSGHSRALAGGGRGLFATRDLTQGETIIEIPAECWISHRTILKSSACAHVLREDPVLVKLIEEDYSWVAIIGLEYERHNEYSFWKEYLHFMRRQESPIWWSDEELKELHSEKMRKDTREQQEYLNKMYNKIYPYLYRKYPHMWNAEENTKESFLWATLTMWGRAFNVAGVNSTGAENGIVPISDLLNHDGGRPSTWYMEYKDGERFNDPTKFVFTANRNTKKGQEIMISYGDKRASYNFFLYCGFIPNGQTFGDYIAISVEKHGRIKRQVAVGNDGRLDGKFYDEFVKLTGLSRKDALNYLIGEVESLLSSYPTSYHDDLEGLSGHDLKYKTWAKLTYRVRMKGIYTRFLENMQHMLKHELRVDIQRYPADLKNAQFSINKRRGIGAADVALDVLRIEITKLDLAI